MRILILLCVCVYTLHLQHQVDLLEDVETTVVIKHVQPGYLQDAETALPAGVAYEVAVPDDAPPAPWVASPAPAEPVTNKTIAAKVTAYCACKICCEADADGRTAWWRGDSKGYASHRGCAIAPKVIPYGTYLNIPGYGRVQADDTGGAMRQSAKRGVVHIDLRFNTHSEAKEWGVQYLDVAVTE